MCIVCRHSVCGWVRVCVCVVDVRTRKNEIRKAVIVALNTFRWVEWREHAHGAPFRFIYTKTTPHNEHAHSRFPSFTTGGRIAHVCARVYPYRSSFAEQLMIIFSWRSVRILVRICVQQIAAITHTHEYLYIQNTINT